MQLCYHLANKYETNTICNGRGMLCLALVINCVTYTEWLRKKSQIFCLRKDTCSKPGQTWFGSWIESTVCTLVSCHANDVAQDVTEKITG